jgi:hypothetical protein
MFSSMRPMLLLKSSIYIIEEKYANIGKCSLVADRLYAELVNTSMICRFNELFLQYSTCRLYGELLEDENGVLKMCLRFVCNYKELKYISTKLFYLVSISTKLMNSTAN